MAKTTKKAESCCAPYDDSEWKARMDCDALIEADKIRRDPKRLAAARAEARKRATALKTVI